MTTREIYESALAAASTPYGATVVGEVNGHQVACSVGWVNTNSKRTQPVRWKVDGKVVSAKNLDKAVA